MRIHVLGSGAGGGFPQWNCNCSNCSRMRRGDMRATPRTQSSIAVSNNNVDWILINASPDVRAQLEAFPEMQPARALRDTAIRSVILIDSQIDHTTGLMMLREKGSPLEIYCTEMVYQDMTSGYPLFKVLKHYCGVDWRPLELNQTFSIPAAQGLKFTAVPLQSEAPPYSPHRHNTQPGDNVGIFIQDESTSHSVFYSPGMGAVNAELMQYFERSDCLLIDGTFWREDEMIQAGVGTKPASEMGHLPQSGENGMLGLLEPLTKQRKILIHINNTNPILDEDSAERAELDKRGIEVAFDGMDIRL